jgi:hypothetical protein
MIRDLKMETKLHKMKPEVTNDLFSYTNTNTNTSPHHRHRRGHTKRMLVER